MQRRNPKKVNVDIYIGKSLPSHSESPQKYNGKDLVFLP